MTGLPLALGVPGGRKPSGGGGSGNVSGPDASTDGNFASFDGADGKKLKDSGTKAADFAAAVHTHPASQISDASANGRSLLTAADYATMRTLLTLNNVNNTSDANKPVSTATQAALDLKAPIASPTFTGTVTLPGDPASALQAATKQYVDGLIANVGKRGRARAATTANITISTGLVAGQTVDGVTLVNGDWVLVKSQTTAAQNGVYIVSASPSRAPEFDTYNEHPGSLIAVEEGTTNADTLWLCTSNDGGTIGTTAINFSKMVIAGELLAANNLSDVANAATARTNLGLAIGTNVQAYDADLTTIAGLNLSGQDGKVLGVSGGVFTLVTGGGTVIASKQEGYVNTTTISTTGVAGNQDFKYIDITVSAVNTAKAVPTFEGSIGYANIAGSGTAIGGYYYYGTTNGATGIITCRMTSSTNLRLSFSDRNSALSTPLSITGQWRIVEYT